MSDRALAATTVATVAVLTGHTTGCACDTCEQLSYVGLPDAVEALVNERAVAMERAHLRGFKVGREFRMTAPFPLAEADQPHEGTR